MGLLLATPTRVVSGGYLLSFLVERGGGQIYILLLGNLGEGRKILFYLFLLNCHKLKINLCQRHILGYSSID